MVEDWETWGEWVSESETVATRKRVCKNKGPNSKCRGKATQKRIKEVKKDIEPQYVYEGQIFSFLKFILIFSYKIVLRSYHP